MKADPERVSLFYMWMWIPFDMHAWCALTIVTIQLVRKCDGKSITKGNGKSKINKRKR
jgi:hypothetical protein